MFRLTVLTLSPFLTNDDKCIEMIDVSIESSLFQLILILQLMMLGQILMIKLLVLLIASQISISIGVYF